MFEFVTTYTYRDFLYLNRLTARRYRRWYTLFYRLFTGIFGAAFTVIGSLLLSEGFSASSLFILVVGVLLILLTVFYDQISALRSRRMTIQNLGQITFTFSDEQFSYVCSKQSAQHTYSSILSFFRYHERYFLFLDALHAYVLPYSGFTAGNRDEFEAFLARKTGKKWDKVYREPKKKKARGNKDAS